jgi:uncharacterized protein
MIKEQINKDYMVAFKSKDTIAKNLLSVIKGEIQTIEKNVGVDNLSDEDVLKILTKTAKSLKETINSVSNDSESEILSKSTAELMIVESYLPKQMSREEITQKVTEIVKSGVTNIGVIMKEFAKLPADKKIVSEVIKEIV